MAGTSVSHLIFFIASVFIAMSVVGVMTVNVSSITSAYTVNSRVFSEQLRTDITIINDPEVIPSSSGNYTFYVKNTGRVELDPNYISVFIDGGYVNVSGNVTVKEGGDVWRTGYVIGINVSTSLVSSGDHRLRVVTENGVSDTMSFKI